MPQTIIGIDPGSSGAIAVLNSASYAALPMPDTERDIWDFLHRYATPPVRPLGSLPQARAVIERVGGFMGPSAGEQGGGRNRAAGHNMFSFGRSYGSLRMALIAAAIPFEEVLPRRWQQGVGISPRKKGETKTEWKNRLKGLAQQLFPTIRVTLATADALLLAEYGRRHYGNGDAL